MVRLTIVDKELVNGGETQLLEEYGITNYDLVEDETEGIFTMRNLFSAGLAVAGIAAWAFREKLVPRLQSAIDYALILRESRRS